MGAERILYELTGLKDIYVEQLQTFGQVNRDPVERTISVAFFALINIYDEASVQLHHAKWVGLKNRPALIFDHEKMVEIALERLRYKAALHPIGFELLPENFTIPQLQKLYEIIYDMRLDRRNFSRKILSTGLLIDTGEKTRMPPPKSNHVPLRQNKVRVSLMPFGILCQNPLHRSYFLSKIVSKQHI
ncbi:MAG: hypothetical protein R2822_09155 [Spirosomataceae bacterium]